MEYDPDYGTDPSFEEDRVKDFEDKGSVLGGKKKFFVLLGLVALIFVAVFALYAFGVISLLVADIIAFPVLLIAVIVWFRYRNRGM